MNPGEKPRTSGRGAVTAHVQERTGSVTAPDEWKATRLREIGPIGVVR